MTEIPEHLLERSKARRAALGLLKDGETASSTTPVKAGDDAPAPAAAAAPAARAAAAPAPVAVKAPEPVPPYVAAALARKKMPVWVVPVLLFLPIWMILYVGTLERPPVAEAGLLAEGSTEYTGKCASCHGPGGGGGVGQQLSNGQVLATFPTAAEHVWWVINGSNAVGIGSPYGNPDRPGGQRIAAGGMAAWASTLSARDLLAVVYYERVRHGGSTEEAELGLHELADSPELPANFAEGTTVEEIEALIAAAETAAGDTAAPAN
ncbi:MAG TPA: c-type cytochrome [Acidimicrobiales bacterium]|nr:c-type cytochrome [Acidimicrobiales bacterium]